MITYFPRAALIPPINALPQPLPSTSIPRAPIDSAIVCEPSKLPLSATITSPRRLCSRNARCAFSMHTANVSASFKQGMTTVTSGGVPPLSLTSEFLISVGAATSVVMDASFSKISTCLRGRICVKIIGTGFGHEIRSGEQTFKRAGIRPPSRKLVPRHLTAVDVSVIYVGDFQLAAARRFESANNVKDLRVVQINSYHCKF